MSLSYLGGLGGTTRDEFMASLDGDEAARRLYAQTLPHVTLPSCTTYYCYPEHSLTFDPSSGRRVLRLHLALYLSSSLSHTPAVLSQYLSQDSLDALLETKELGAGGSVGKAWGLENVMRWREVVSHGGRTELAPSLTRCCLCHREHRMVSLVDCSSLEGQQ